MQTITAKKLLSFFFLLVGFTTQLSSQQSPADALKKLYDEYPNEKIYLWYNKPAYVAGETIWFKAYVFSGYDLSFISTSLYVELYDAEKKLLSTKLLPLISGVTEGSIDLANKLDEGVYYIRAYTQWMLNFNEAFQYIHPVKVYNTASIRKLSVDHSKWNAAAMPEGGVLVEGIRTKVAVRRYAALPLKSRWSGYVYEESNPEVKITEFNAIDENVALFSFIPESRKKYLVSVKDEFGKMQICPLPFVKSSGVAITIEDAGDSITYSLNFINIAENGKDYSVLGEVQHQTVYYAELKKTLQKFSLKIPADNLDNGILHLTVFDPQKQPVAERLLFLNYAKLKYDSAILHDQLISVQSRTKNKLQFKIDSNSWFTYAVSVTDDASELSYQDENILSGLWLSGDLTKPIQNPARYFTDANKEKEAALDAIMISEKWMHYNWNEVMNNKYPVIRFPLHNFLSYTGKVTKGNKLKPNEEVNLILYHPDSSAQIMQALSDNAGNIIIDNILFSDTAKIFYQLNTKKYAGKLIDIQFESNNKFIPYPLFLPEVPYRISELSMAENKPAWVDRATNTLGMETDIEKKYKMLQEVVVRSKLKTATQELNEKLSSGLFNSSNEIVFDFVNVEQNAIGSYNILQWLEGRVAGLMIQFEDGNYVPYIRGSRASLYIDEMPADANLVSTINISDIAMIKIIKGPFALMTGSGTGTIAIYTARGNMRPAQREPSLPNNKITGYNKVKNFFAPDYGIRSAPQPNVDKRDQLLWQTHMPPYLSVDKTLVEFYNNDSAKRFRIIVQGFTESGFPVYFEKIISPTLKSF